MSPSPTKRHQQATYGLASVLRQGSPAGIEVVEGWGWKPGDDEYVPDVIVVDETAENLPTGTLAP